MPLGFLLPTCRRSHPSLRLTRPRSRAASHLERRLYTHRSTETTDIGNSPPIRRWVSLPLLQAVLIPEIGMQIALFILFGACTVHFAGVLRRRYALSIGALLLALVLLIPIGVSA